MDCNLTDKERRLGNRCRSWDCVGCAQFANKEKQMGDDTLKEAFEILAERGVTVEQYGKLLKNKK